MNILTEEEMREIGFGSQSIRFARAIEALLMSKLAEQISDAPVATVVISTIGMFAGIKRNLVLHQDAPLLFDGDKLYTEAQYLAAQQRTAEACAKVCAKRSDTLREPACLGDATAIRNSEWREYL